MSLVGHSLGSVVLYDMLIKQKTEINEIWDEDEDLQLDFKVENLFMMGSPLALFA